jgi:hypothetical protein
VCHCGVHILFSYERRIGHGDSALTIVTIEQGNDQEPISIAKDCQSF